LQRIIPVGLRGLVRKDVYEAIAELGAFFRELCSRNLRVDVVKKLKKDIPLILCKLEKIFPPAFFDVMVHLVVHLPDQALLRGPVQYGWMYPIERRLGTFKNFVRNRDRPEGSIAEAYVASDTLTFCSRLMQILTVDSTRLMIVLRKNHCMVTYLFLTIVLLLLELIGANTFLMLF
jgi:hypothetical protein